MVELNQIILGDCLEVTKEIPDKSANLIIADIPYNIGKGEWDKWKKQDDYINYIGERFLECQRVLKDNGSFYWFHNDFLQVVGLQNFINRKTDFIFKRLVVWNKRFDNTKLKNYLDGYVSIEGDRNYRLMAEYLFFYTFQDETGLTTVMLDVNNFPALRKYFKELQEWVGLGLKKINNRLGHRKAEHSFYWKTTQWDLPTPETYRELIDKFNINRWDDFREYESLRYTFNNQKTHHSVWNYEIENGQGHPTQKPKELIKNIILHSSNETDLILDPFSGSGTTAIACLELNRNFICIEKDPMYHELSVKRVNNYKSQMKMKFAEAV